MGAKKSRKEREAFQETEKSQKEREAIQGKGKSRNTGRAVAKGLNLPNTGKRKSKRRRGRSGGLMVNPGTTKSVMMRIKREREGFPKGRRMKMCMVQGRFPLAGKVKSNHMQAETLIQGLVLGRRAKKELPKRRKKTVTMLRRSQPQY